MEQLQVQVRPDSRTAFHNRADWCVGTGRVGLALHQEYQRQLQAVQALCGFRHIRGHGLFCDDMSIYQEWTDRQSETHINYNFTYLDRVVDAWLAAGVKPFLELGFMPKKLASGEQTIFYWQGNTTPPKDHGAWAALVKATLTHLKQRYGEDEVSEWPCEVWNEPNLPGFWAHADRAAYLRLYEASVHAVKEVLPRMPVGGPAVCGGGDWPDWIRDFLQFCQERQLPVDFVSRHHYMANTPTYTGRYTYHSMAPVSQLLDEVHATRQLIDSFPAYQGLPLHITEFNTSYNPRCPIHDTVYNAALVAGLLARMGDWADSYSYWTFGDVFEETGVPVSPFHGGFGLMADGCIPKPTLWTYHFFNHLRGECVYRDDGCLVMRCDDGSYEGVAWRMADGPAQLRLTLPAQGRVLWLRRSVNSSHGNPLQLWLDMGQPACPDQQTLQLLRESAHPLVESSVLQAEDGSAQCLLSLERHQVSWFRLAAAPETPDIGYDPSMYL